MHGIPGYSDGTKIYESETSVVLRAQRKTDGQPVILKALKGRHPGARDLESYRSEFELLRELDGEAAIPVVALESYDNALVLVLEDVGADSLDKLAERDNFDLEEWLQVFIAAAQALARLHQKHIVHRQTNPSNIVYNPDTGVCKLIDFGLGLRLSPTHPGQFPERLEGNLAYIAPEQTGRINRPVDYRSDLYSLGATMYRLLTGRLPFEKEQSLEMVYAHIATVPEPAHALNSTVPPMVSQIIEKLLQKSVESRYQSAAGLRADLQGCLQSLRDSGRIIPFTLGAEDRTDILYLPQKLYGREREIGLLTKTIEARLDGDGGTGLALVSGYSGVGKTSLVKEAYKRGGHNWGHFVEGKFDQYQRTMPYYAFKQALGSLVDGWLAEPEERLADIAATLRTALGDAGGVMLEVVPSLELIIGPQPPVPELSGVEAQNRFNNACSAFFRCAASAENPLLVFLDDLQWADLASLNLISVLLSDKRVSHVFLIGAYRDNETWPSHPLMLMVERLETNGVSPTRIQVHNLSEQDVAALCADALRADSGEVEPLAHRIHTKTLGNPFFVTQFLETLSAEGLIRAAPSGTGWHWDMESIDQHDIPDDVVQLMAAKITSFAPRIQTLLTLAACIGNTFSLETLAIIGQHTPEATRNELTEAVREGLLIPLGESAYRFSHDRIQQAAYSLMEDAASTHLRIGRLLLSHSDGRPTGEQLFAVVNQLNAAEHLITDPEERLRLAALNRDAGVQARNAAAYTSALKYMTAAVELLCEDAWCSHYPLTFSIYSELAWCRFHAGESEGIEAIFDTLLSRANSVEDRVHVHKIRMEHYHLEGDYTRAVAIQKEALGLLGVQLDENESITALLNQELERVPALLAGREIESLYDAPAMESSVHASIMDILMRLWTSAYLDSQLELVAWASCKMTNISLEHGNSSLTSYGYMNYGFVCVALLGQYDTGHRFGQVALRLADRFDNALLRGKVNLLFAVFVNHWRAPLASSLDYSLKSFPLLVENGDWTYAGYCAEFIVSDPTIWGMRCDEILELAQRYMPFLENNAPVVVEEFFRPACLNPVLQLVGQTHGDDTFDDDDFQEARFVREYQDNHLALSYFYTAKLRSLYWFGHWEKALAMLDKADFVASVALAQAKVPEAYFFACLTMLGGFDRVSGARREAFTGKITEYQQKMGEWARHSPDNFEHKYLLVEAERARVDARDWQALDYYQAAREAARQARYINNEALACECTGRFLLDRGMKHLAAPQLEEAHYLWRKWGATAKVAHLESRHADLLSPSLSKTEQGGDAVFTGGGEPMEMAVKVDDLDIPSIVKASQSLASEIQLERVLDRMMAIVLENAGADRAMLVACNEDQWILRREASPSGQIMSTSAGAAVDPQNAPHSLLNYCLRKRESVLLGHAAGYGSFTQDPYFAATRMKSALAMPLLRSEMLKGVLYLENSLTEEAFTRRHLRVLELLSSQIAISIENAELYGALEEIVDKRTAQLVDVNEALQQANSQLQKISELDGLTGIANRRLFDDRLQSELKRHQRLGHHLALAIYDVDNFKLYNDTYGHVAGDQCLKNVAAAIHEALGRPGDLVARYGGEEFVILLPETDRNGLCAVLDRVRENVQTLGIPHVTSATDPNVTLSVGALSWVPQQGQSTQDALVAADAALYQAKDEGRNRVVLAPPSWVRPGGAAGD